MKEMQKLRCGKCGTHMANEEDGEVSVRFKTFCVYARGGIVVIICRGCSCPNYYADAEYKQKHPEILQKTRNYINMVEAKTDVWLSREDYLKQKGNPNHV